MISKVKKLLVRHEGLIKRAYICQAGKITIGVGRNLENRGITEEEALYLLQNDINEAIGFLEQFEWWEDLNEDRKSALIDMYHNLGSGRFMQFKRMLSALEKRNYEKAAYEMIKSRWCIQTGNRVYELADIMRKGEMII